MFKRNIFKYLREWKMRKNRKPLVLRGARQVGKTFSISEFGKQEFSSFIYLNLEREADKRLFRAVLPAQEMLAAIEVHTGQKIVPGETLIFIDEIQESEIAMSQLRFFYEELPQLHIVAAGSLLEVKLKKEGFSFPVGRVEFLYLHPAGFEEFLDAIGESPALDYLKEFSLKKTIPEPIHQSLSRRYLEYAVVGGMPEAVACFAAERSFVALNNIYESLLTGFRDDVHKYVSMAKSGYVQHVVEHSPRFVGMQIKYENFGGAGYKGREMKAAFDALEKAMLVLRIFATPSQHPPLMCNYKKAPKLAFLDSGLVSYRLDARQVMLQEGNLNCAFQGQIAEQMTAQTLIALDATKQSNLAYWYREKAGASSEVDFVYPHGESLCPIEVKSGTSGRLRSLHQFIDDAEAKIAVRVYSGQLTIEDIFTKGGRKYKLLSIPFYLLHRLPALLSELENF